MKKGILILGILSLLTSCNDNLQNKNISMVDKMVGNWYKVSEPSSNEAPPFKQIKKINDSTLLTITNGNTIDTLKILKFNSDTLVTWIKKFSQEDQIIFTIDPGTKNVKYRMILPAAFTDSYYMIKKR